MAALKSPEMKWGASGYCVRREITWSCTSSRSACVVVVGLMGSRFVARLGHFQFRKRVQRVQRVETSENDWMGVWKKENPSSECGASGRVFKEELCKYLAYCQTKR